MRTRSLLLFTLFTAFAVVLLVGLGLWQLERREWKEALIAKIEARVKAEPVGLDEARARLRRGEDINYLRARVEGRFEHAEERHLYALSGNEPGWHVITPLVTPTGAAIYVDRGFVPRALKEPASRAAGQVEGTVTVTGPVRLPERQGLFVPDNDAAQNRWFWRDLPSMAATLPRDIRANLAPFFIEAERGSIPGGWPRGGETRLTFPNDHLQYAITWFLLAASVLAIYLVYLRGRLRQRPGGGHVAGQGSGG